MEYLALEVVGVSMPLTNSWSSYLIKGVRVSYLGRFLYMWKEGVAWNSA